MLDLSLVDFLDLPGARALLFGTSDYRRDGGQVRLCSPQPHVARLIHLLGVDRQDGVHMEGEATVTTHSAFRHGLLVHDTDEELIAATQAFVARGLASGADVLVHGTSSRIGLLREALGHRPRLEYGLDEELYQQPTRTLFAYQRTLAERADSRRLWVTGTVPRGQDAAEQAAWHRYESAVDEALGAFPFVALCTYDTPGPTRR